MCFQEIRVAIFGTVETPFFAVDTYPCFRLMQRQEYVTVEGHLKVMGCRHFEIAVPHDVASLEIAGSRDQVGGDTGQGQGQPGNEGQGHGTGRGILPHQVLPNLPRERWESSV